MQVETTPTAAELELEASLKQLREMIASVPEDKWESLSLVQASLLALDEAMNIEDSLCFVQALVGLARALIELRQSKDGGALSTLPVPPYDLWLPFKAKALRPSDKPSSRYTAAGPVRNKKIADELSALLELFKLHNSKRIDSQRTVGTGEEGGGS